MRKTAEAREAEAAQFAEFLCNDTTANKAHETLQEMSSNDVNELCTTILTNGHTILHLLAQRQKLNSLRVILQRGVDVHTRNGHGDTPLHVALQHNALFSAKVLTDHGANTCEVVSRRKGSTLLHMMVTCDRPHAVMLLLEEKADANVRDKEGRTPFHLAAVYGNTVIAAVLIKHEACDVNAVDATGHTALMLAILNNNQDLARQLVDAPRVDTVSRDKDGMACLHLAVANGQLEVVRTILRRNTAHINGKEHRMGRTPIHFACALTCSPEATAAVADDVEEHNSDEIDTRSARCSLSVVAEANKVDTEKCRRVENGDAKTSGRRRVTHADFRGGKSHHENRPSSSQQSYLSPIPPASPPHESQSTPRAKRSAGSPRVYGASTSRHNGIPNGANNAKTTTLLVTPTKSGGSESGGKQHVRHSIAGDGRAESPRVQRTTTPRQRAPHAGPVSSLHHQRPATAPAIRSHQSNHTNAGIFSTSHPGYKIPSIFSARDGATSHRGRDSAVTRLTPLNVSLIRSRLVSLLLEHGADANLMTAFRKSPLHISVMMGAADIVTLLLPHVTNPNVLSAANRTALHLAAERGHASIAHQLIGVGANSALRDINGMSALHLAAALGHVDVVATLLRAKADKNSCDFRQMMPLHHACLHGHNEVAAMLIQAGANQERVDNDGFLPQQYIKRHEKSSSVVSDIVGDIVDSNSPGLSTVASSMSYQSSTGSSTEVSSSLDSNNSARTKRGATSNHGAVNPVRLPPASTLEIRNAGRLLTRIPAGKEAVFPQTPLLDTTADLNENSLAIPEAADHVNGVDHAHTNGQVATSPRRRKTGVSQSFTDNTLLQSAGTSTIQHQPIPKVLYNGIPQAN